MWRTIILRKIRAHKILALILIVVAAVSSFTVAYPFTGIGTPAGTCPALHWSLGPTGEGPMPFSIMAVRSLNLAQNPYAGTGPVTWCLYSSWGLLMESYRTNKILGPVQASGNGSYVVVAGYLALPGPAEIWANGTIYMFDRDGRILWSFSTPDSSPIFSATLSGDASVIVASSPGLYYFNNKGTLLWSGSGLGYGSTMAAQLVNDGQNVVTGFSNYKTGSDIVMYNNQGKILWNYSINDSSIIDSIHSIAVSANHIAAGTSVSGYNGTLYYMDFSGTLLWSRHVDSAILGVEFIQNSQEISVQTNWGTQTYDLNGNPA